MLARKDEQLELAKEILTTFPSMKSYYENVLYGTSGYYTTGKVNFKKDYLTFASNPNEVLGLSAALAYQLYLIRKSLIANQILKEADPFNILECGGGMGDLCFTLIETIYKVAKVRPLWESFAKSLHYHLVEISPALAKKQRERNLQFEKQVTVINGDARHLNELLLGKKIGAVLSNELIDNLPMHAVKLDDKNNLKLKQVIPMITEKKFIEFFNSNQSEVTLDALKKESTHLKAILIAFNPEFKIKDGILLSEMNFLKLHAITAENNTYQAQFFFTEMTCVDANLIQEINDFNQRHPKFFSNLKRNETYLLEVGIKDYLQNVQQLLLPGGEMITIDYGAHHYGADIHQLRTFTNHTLDFNIYASPGFIDITHDMNATTMVEEGVQLGLKLRFYGKQSQLPIDQYPSTVICEAYKAFFKRICDEGSFEVIVQYKELENEHERIQIPNTRFLGESWPVFHNDFAEVMSKLKKLEIETAAKLSNLQTQTFLKLTNEHIQLIDEMLKMGSNNLSIYKRHLINFHKAESIVIGERKYTLETLMKTIYAYEGMYCTFIKMKDSKFITKEEKEFLLQDPYLKMQEFITQYPTQTPNLQIPLSTNQAGFINKIAASQPAAEPQMKHETFRSSCTC